MDYEEIFNKALESNPVMKEFFEEHPELKEPYLEKMRDEDDSGGGAYGKANPVYCRTCVFAYGTRKFEDGPDKFYCAIYHAGGPKGKPPEVYIDGQECEYYEKIRQKKHS